MADDDFPTRLAAAMGDDGDGGDGLPTPSAVVAGVLAPLRGAEKSPGGHRFDVESTDHAEKRYTFTCDVGFAGENCTARLVVFREDGHVYARSGVEPPESGGLLSRVRGSDDGYDALGVDADVAAGLAERRKRLVEDGIVNRVTTARTTEDPAGFELRFETSETSMVTVTGYDDGRDYLAVPLPDLALRAVVAERKALR
ncbi:hypothetical protein [Halobacterium wangiae]|uniref:hypothetical protein n=1 Tax=Halobacterium wangiae TaxID=2902623 RepID=UPI001E42559A|nr:hypothetical protein [Halobacterium wangiae]